MIFPMANLIASQNIQRQQSTRRFNPTKDNPQEKPCCSQEFFDKICDAEFQKFINGNKAKPGDVEDNN